MIDPTVGKMYLAANNLHNAITKMDFNPKQYPEIHAAWAGLDKAMTQYDLELGPLPEWASGWNHSQEPVLFAQLFTLNGRERGNGMIYHVVGDSFGVITDMGNTMVLNLQELYSCYEIGDFILNEEAYEKRKRQQDEEPAEFMG